ncbi:MAG: hypothetical protein IT488_00725 [Gammaproteobacteria bacterium]|nr:hypothetical protein [Gammaproteobacteria bacterium]
MSNMLGSGRAGRSSAEPEAVLDSQRVVELMRCFPIGSKFRYYPEYHKEITFESIIIAYGINNHFVYTQRDIRVDSERGVPVFVLEDPLKDRAISQVRHFSLLIPDVSVGDARDYRRQSDTPHHGRFRRGDILTLLSIFNEKGIPHVNTMVRKRVQMREGYYANHAVIQLEVLIDTLNHIDQRQQRRVKTSIPATMQFSDDSPHYPCTLVDFTETALRIRLDESGDSGVVPLIERRNMIVSLDLPAQSRRFVLTGKVLRRDAGHFVIALNGKIKDGQPRDFELIDAFDLKATLLQHPATLA